MFMYVILVMCKLLDTTSAAIKQVEAMFLFVEDECNSASCY